MFNTKRLCWYTCTKFYNNLRLNLVLLKSESTLDIIVFGFSLDAEGTTDHICQWVNDACESESNAVMMLKVFGSRERLCLFAKKDIEAGQELTYNYGDKEGNLWWRKKV